MNQTELLLEYQRLDEIWEKLEKQKYSNEVQYLLEDIWERQCEILNFIILQ